jgi:hypothetical protein
MESVPRHRVLAHIIRNLLRPKTVSFIR